MLIESLTAEEARVLGTLMEKSLATPDYYPMTLNALRTACNQKSSRDPVSDYDEETVSRALTGLKRKTLVTFIPYGSQADNFKYRHFLEDPRFRLAKPELAVLSVLLLRGAQTLNEIRLRASSQHPISGLEAAEALLKGLAARPEPLAEFLAKRPGWKEPRWRDTLRPPDAEQPESEGLAVSAADPVAPRIDPARNELESVREEVAGLRADLAELRAVVEKIRSELY